MVVSSVKGPRYWDRALPTDAFLSQHKAILLDPYPKDNTILFSQLDFVYLRVINLAIFVEKGRPQAQIPSGKLHELTKGIRMPCH